MHIVLIGADCEENLGLGILAAVAEAEGHAATIVPFDRLSDLDRVVERTLAAGPDVIGLGMQFQYRSHEFLHLSHALRRAGFGGHITTGGQFPSLAWREVLDPAHGIDSVVFYDGEETLADLLAALAAGDDLDHVAGLALRGPEGPFRTASRPLVADLDQVPFPRRYRPHTRHLGIPFIPIMGGRGCWGKCRYCSITSVYRDAHEHGGGRMLRHRSPDNVAAEMALLWHRAGGPCMFCFHDDNLLLPKPAASLTRMRALRAALDDYGVGRAAIIGKCRPETLTPELARELADMGVIRLYAGVENASAAGSGHLGRGRQHEAVRDALAACRAADIFVCYNLLLFEPETELADVRENIAFIRDHAAHPINFCRAEAYYGTPLHRDLAEEQMLGGSFMGWNYRMHDERAEVLFRIAAATFRHRNFHPGGVANRYMGLGYAAKVLDFFYGPSAEITALRQRARTLTEHIARDTAEHLETAVDLVEHTSVHDRGAIERATMDLGLAVAAADRVWHRELDRMYEDMSRLTRPAPAPAPRKLPSKLLTAARSLALGLTLAAAGCGGSGDGDPDARPPDARVNPPPPPDPPPPPPPEIDAGIDAGDVDAAPVDAGAGAAFDDGDDGDQGDELGQVTPTGDQAGVSAAPVKLTLIDQWTDTSPKRAMRTGDLPLHQPPRVTLAVERESGRILVRLRGADAVTAAEWSADGTIDVADDGHAATWTPRDDGDRLSVAVRAPGGVTVLAMGASERPRPAWA
ncbi:B12-binding domain-containing radical SAM protein [Haliangium sp.]|uniref:B12-binding domain-containing radical SAM protein n=1 Tax=Haliangium sp. TaxID=2663208 RepID=UPI003D1420BE